MEYIPKRKFIHKMLEYFRKVDKTGVPTGITSHNKPIHKIEPNRTALKVSDVFGVYWGKIRIPENVMEPETDEWGESIPTFQGASSSFKRRRS